MANTALAQPETADNAPDAEGVGTRSLKTYRSKQARKYYRKQLRQKWMGRVQLMTLDDLDHRSKAYRKAQALYNEIAEAYGPDLDFQQRQLASSVALLTAWIEDIAVRSFIGEKVNKDTAAVLINTRRKEMSSL